MISEEDLCSRHQVSAQDLHKRSPGKICVQDLYKSFLCTDLCKRSLGKISLRGLLASSQKISLHCLCTGSLQEVSRQDLCTRSLSELCWQDLCKGSLGKTSEQDLHKKSLARQAPSKSLLVGFLYEMSRCMRGCKVDMHMGISQEPRTLKENAGCKSRKQRFARASAIEMHMDILQEPFVWKFTGTMAADTSGDIVLSEPVQSKWTWTWTCHKSRFVWNSQGKCKTRIPGQAFCVDMHMDISRKLFCVKITGSWPDTDETTLAKTVP